MVEPISSKSVFVCIIFMSYCLEVLADSEAVTLYPDFTSVSIYMPFKE